MTSRSLPVAEWDKLGATAIATVRPYVAPEDMEVVVVEDGDRIVGAWAVMRIVHLEGLWIDPEYRGRVGVARRLYLGTMAVARRWAPRWVMTGADTDDVRAMLTKAGAQHIPMDVYVMETTCH